MSSDASMRAGNDAVAQTADFGVSNNPFSQKPIEATFGSTTKSRNSGGTSGILPAERARATFDVEKMTNIIDGSAKATARRRFFAGPVEDADGFDKYYMSRPEVFYQAWKNWQNVHEPYLEKFKLQPKDLGSMSHASVTGSGAGTHWAVFNGAIRARGTDAQAKAWAERGHRMKIIGGYAQTELGHGSNVRGLETTATYDKSTQEFVLDSPTLTSTKWWISNLGKLSTHALVYAQLILDGKEYGIHEFVVQIRDENHRPLPGIQVGDIGDCVGSKANDPGFLRLDHVRVPRDRMLARHQQVLADGTYVKSPSKKNPYAHYFTMLRTRAGIVTSASGTLARGCTIAIRYSAVRHQGFKDAAQGVPYQSPENSVMDYQVQRYRLFKNLATAYGGYFGARYLNTMFSQIGDVGANVEKIKQVASTTAGLKSLVTNLTLDGLEDLRKCCGGHGYLLASGVAAQVADYMPAPTYEGDWVILYLQTARYLVKTVRDLKESGKKPEGQLDYLLPEYATDPETSASPSDYKNPSFLLKVLKYRARGHVLAAAEQFFADLDTGLTWAQAWAKNGIILVTAAKNHTIAFWFYLYAEAVKEIEDRACREALEQLCLCFGLTNIVDFFGARALSASGHAYGVRALGDVLEAIRPNAVALVDAFDFTDASLVSALGRKDGNVYEALFETTKRVSVNQTDPFPGYDLYLRKLLDQNFLKLGNDKPLASASKL